MSVQRGDGDLLDDTINGHVGFDYLPATAREGAENAVGEQHTPRKVPTSAEPIIAPGIAGGSSIEAIVFTIQLTAKGPSFSISVETTAMEDGQIGNRIRVTSSARGQPLYAEVVDVGRVRLLRFK